MLTEQEVLDRLRKAVAAAGSQRAFGRQHDISPMYISDVLRKRRKIGEAILDALGVERVVSYRVRSEDDA
jgi:hypothetical protein